MADAAEAREQAREILGQRRYEEADVPRPFRDPLSWLGGRLEDLGVWLGDRVDGLDGALPGGSWVVWVLLAAVVAGGTVLLARAVVRRRSRMADEREEARVARVLEPRELEREADDAERDGAFDRAVRLRFRAGVMRLRVAEGATTRTIAADLRSEAFDALGEDFDAVAYGGRPATGRDAETARERWREVLR